MSQAAKKQAIAPPNAARGVFRWSHQEMSMKDLGSARQTAMISYQTFPLDGKTQKKAAGFFCLTAHRKTLIKSPTFNALENIAIMRKD
jgi:hypothetical protein